MYATATKQAMKEDVELSEAEVVTKSSEPEEVTTDMLRGREEGGKSNSFKSFKLKLKSDGEMKAPGEEEADETEARKSIKAKDGLSDKVDNLDPKFGRSGSSVKEGLELDEVVKNTDIVNKKEKMARLSDTGKGKPMHNVAKGLKAFLKGKAEPMESVEVQEANDSHTHAAHYEDPKTGEWTGMQLMVAKDDEDAIRQAHEKCKEGCRLSKVERHTTVKEEKNWIAGAIKKPGAETAAAKRAGMSVQAYAQKHKHDSGKAGKRARLALTLKKMHHEEVSVEEESKPFKKNPVPTNKPAYKVKAFEAKTLSPGQDDAPFEPPYHDIPKNIKDKSGAVHTPMSRAKDLARKAMKRVKTEMLGKAPGNN
jgi:hypothetical protein